MTDSQTPNMAAGGDDTWCTRSVNADANHAYEIRLALAAIQGDEAAFLERTDMERDKLYAIALSYTRNQADALESVQEAVCRAWIKRRTLREPRYYGTWLVRIVLRVCMDSNRRRARERTVGNREMLPASGHIQDAGADPARRLADRLLIETALDRLNKEERMVVVLKYYRDMTLTDIAELLEKPLGTVKTRLHKALSKLRIELRKEEGGER